MKRFALSLVMAVFVLAANAFSYERAREQALFLTDKMAYELNLTQEQFDLAYQINLDYLMNVTSSRDVYGVYWRYRNDDLRYILYDWQYALYATLDYFYQPLRWVRSAWYFPVYSHYSRTHFFFGRPGVYISYRGGWRPSPQRSVSPYASHRPNSGRAGVGMRDHHYPGAQPSHRGGSNHGNTHNDGYRPGSHNGQGYGRGNQGQGSQGRGQGSVGNQGQGSQGQGYGRGNQGQGSQGRGQGSVGSQEQGSQGQGYGRGNQGQGSQGRGQGSVGSQSQGSQGQGSQGRGQGSVGSQSQGSQGQGSQGRGQGSVGSQSSSRQQNQASPSSRSNSRGRSNSTGRTAGRSYGR